MMIWLKMQNNNLFIYLNKRMIEMETILEFFKYLIVRFWIFIEKRTIFKLWNPFLDFLERFRKYMSDDKFEIVKYIVIVLLIIVIMLLFRLIYCKFFLKEDFKNICKRFFSSECFNA